MKKPVKGGKTVTKTGVSIISQATVCIHT